MLAAGEYVRYALQAVDIPERLARFFSRLALISMSRVTGVVNFTSDSERLREIGIVHHRFSEADHSVFMSSACPRHVRKDEPARGRKHDLTPWTSYPSRGGLKMFSIRHKQKIVYNN